MNKRLLFFGAWMVVIAGCPGPSEAPDAFVVVPDGGGGTDGGPDAGRDTGPSMPDMGVDGGSDAGMPNDAFVPNDAFSVACGTTCDDGDPCNGVETCDATSGTCVPGSALPCDDGMACTTDSCMAGVGCQHDEADTDGDGVFDCTDCAPTDNTRYMGAPEICNSLDDDCDTNVDEDTVSDFYADCDGDGYAPSGANMTAGCTVPTSDPGCGTATQTWTARLPDVFVDYDCNDEVAEAHSHVAAFSTTPMATTPDTGLSYDYDCDGAETSQFTATGSCVMTTSCAATMGWMGSVPACGASGTFITGCGSSCTPTTETRTQGCR